MAARLQCLFLCIEQLESVHCSLSFDKLAFLRKNFSLSLSTREFLASLAKCAARFYQDCAGRFRPTVHSRSMMERCWVWLGRGRGKDWTD